MKGESLTQMILDYTPKLSGGLYLSLSLSQCQRLTADLGILISLQQQWQVKLDRNTQYHSIENVIYHTVVQDKPQQWRNSGVARTRTKSHADRRLSGPTKSLSESFPVTGC